MDIGGVVQAFFDNAGPGGVVVLLVIGAACLIYYFLTRWIVTAGKEDKAAKASATHLDETPVSKHA